MSEPKYFDKKDPAVEQALAQRHKFFFAKENDGKGYKFSSLPTFREFWTHYGSWDDPTLEPSKPLHLYEVIKAENRRKSYFDIEWEGVEDESHVVIESIVEWIREKHENYFENAGDMKAFVSCGSRPKGESFKNSYHVVFSSGFRDLEDQKPFVKYLEKEAEAFEHGSKIDLAVYTRDRCFCTLWSSKRKDAEWKLRPMGDRYDEKNVRSHIIQGNTPLLQPRDAIIEARKKEEEAEQIRHAAKQFRRDFTGDISAFDDDVIKAMVSFAQKHDPAGCGEVRDTSEEFRSVDFWRCDGGYCEVCQRDHDHDNTASVYLWHGNVYYRFRRGMKRPLLIDSLLSEEERFPDSIELTSRVAYAEEFVKRVGVLESQAEERVMLCLMQNCGCEGTRLACALRAKRGGVDESKFAKYLENLSRKGQSQVRFSLIINTAKKQGFHKEIEGKLKIDPKDLINFDNIEHTMEYYQKRGLAVERYDEPYVRDVDPVNHVSIIRAYLGKGKTMACIKVCKELLDRDSEARILVLSPRETFARNIAEEYTQGVGSEFVCYKNIESGVDFSSHQFLVCQMESLWRLRKEFRPYDLLIIDESEACFGQMVSIGTHKKMLLQNCAMFERLMNTSNRFLCADAFLGQKTLHVLDEFGLLGGARLYINESKAVPRKCVEIKDSNCKVAKTKFMSAINHDLEKGKNLYLFCSSCEFANQIVETVCYNGDEEKYSHILYSSGMSPETRASLQSVRDAWKEVRIVITTPSITVGVNFDLKHFHKAYVYGSAYSCVVRDVFQGLMRTRHLIDNEIVYTVCLKKNLQYKPLSIPEFRETEDLETQIVKDVVKYADCAFRKTPTWFRTVMQYVEVEKNLSERLYREMFQQYLGVCNYTHDSSVEVADDAICELECKTEVVPSFGCVSLSVEESVLIDKRSKDEFIDDTELLMMKKYQFIRKLDAKVNDTMEEVDELWKKHVKNGSHLVNAHNERNYSVEDFIQRERRIDPASAYIEVASKKTARFCVVKRILRKLGLDYSTAVKEFKEEEFRNLMLKLTAKDCEEIRTVFSLRKHKASKKAKKKSIPQYNKETHILNPDTLRPVKRSGRIGEKLVELETNGELPTEEELTKLTPEEEEEARTACTVEDIKYYVNGMLQNWTGSRFVLKSKSSKTMVLRPLTPQLFTLLKTN